MQTMRHALTSSPRGLKGGLSLTAAPRLLQPVRPQRLAGPAPRTRSRQVQCRAQGRPNWWPKHWRTLSREQVRELEEQRRLTQEQKADMEGSLLGLSVLGVLALGQWFLLPFSSECDARVFLAGYGVIIFVAFANTAAAYLRYRYGLWRVEQLEAGRPVE